MSNEIVCCVGVANNRVAFMLAWFRSAQYSLPSLLQSHQFICHFIVDKTWWSLTLEHWFVPCSAGCLQLYGLLCVQTCICSLSVHSVTTEPAILSWFCCLHLVLVHTTTCVSGQLSLMKECLIQSALLILLPHSIIWHWAIQYTS